jgi:hypothetical protein
MRVWLTRFVRAHLITEDPYPELSNLDLLDTPKEES